MQQGLLDPVDRRHVSIRALAPIAELGQPSERVLVALKTQTSDQFGHRVRFGGLRLGRLSGRHRRQETWTHGNRNQATYS